jgi:hypothetical protein
VDLYIHSPIHLHGSKKWREEWANSNWANINEDLVYKKIICCTNVIRIKLLGKYLFKVKCKWENKVRGDLNPHPKTSW